ncbi:hypothetical protein Chor_002542, partial [Crotalus horridus]
SLSSLLPQLAGTAVLGIGLWLRFDSQTKDIFQSDENNTKFYNRKDDSHWCKCSQGTEDGQERIHKPQGVPVRPSEKQN